MIVGGDGDTCPFVQGEVEDVHVVVVLDLWLEGDGGDGKNDDEIMLMAVVAMMMMMPLRVMMVSAEIEPRS